MTKAGTIIFFWLCIKCIIMFTYFVVWGKSFHRNYCSIFTSPKCSLRSIMDYQYGVVLQALQRMQNLLAWIICNDFDYIYFRGIEMVRTLRLKTIRERRDYFLRTLMFKCIHGLAAHYLYNDVIMDVDINGYYTRSAESMDLYVPCCPKGIYKISFLYKGSSLWNELPPCLKQSISIIDVKRNYRLLYGWWLP